MAEVDAGIDERFDEFGLIRCHDHSTNAIAFCVGKIAAHADAAAKSPAPAIRL